MEHEPRLVEPGCVAEVDRGRHGAAFVAQEEAPDPVPEEQPAGEEAGDRGAVPHDAGGPVV